MTPISTALCKFTNNDCIIKVTPKEFNVALQWQIMLKTGMTVMEAG